MKAMKDCLLRRKESIVQSNQVEPLFSACAAVLDLSIQEALDWATTQKEDHTEDHAEDHTDDHTDDHAGINDPGEKCIDFIE